MASLSLSLSLSLFANVLLLIFVPIFAYISFIACHRAIAVDLAVVGISICIFWRLSCCCCSCIADIPAVASTLAVVCIRVTVGVPAVSDVLAVAVVLYAVLLARLFSFKTTSLKIV